MIIRFHTITRPEASSTHALRSLNFRSVASRIAELTISSAASSVSAGLLGASHIGITLSLSALIGVAGTVVTGPGIAGALATPLAVDAAQPMFL